jgi:transposase
MAHLSITAHDTVPALKQTLRTTHDEAFKNRLKAVQLALQGKKRYEIATQLMVDPASITLWIQKYNHGGTAALKLSKGGRPEGNPKWEAAIFESLATEIDKGGYWSIPRMQEWLKKTYQKDVPEQTVWYRMNQLNYSYKSARPHPVQGNEERQKSFKKGASPLSWSRS